MKKAPAVRHKVTASMQKFELIKNNGNSTFEIRKGSCLLGALEVGQGSIRWQGAGKRGWNFKHYSWTKFAEIMNTLAYEGGKVTKE